MPAFDIYLLGTICFGILIFFLNLFNSEREFDDEVYWLAGLLFVSYTALSVFMAYHFAWPSNLLRIESRVAASVENQVQSHPETVNNINTQVLISDSVVNVTNNAPQVSSGLEKAPTQPAEKKSSGQVSEAKMPDNVVNVAKQPERVWVDNWVQVNNPKWVEKWETVDSGYWEVSYQQVNNPVWVENWVLVDDGYWRQEVIYYEEHTYYRDNWVGVNNGFWYPEQRMANQPYYVDFWVQVNNGYWYDNNWYDLWETVNQGYWQDNYVLVTLDVWVDNWQMVNQEIRDTIIVPVERSFWTECWKTVDAGYWQDRYVQQEISTWIPRQEQINVSYYEDCWEWVNRGYWETR